MLTALSILVWVTIIMLLVALLLGSALAVMELRERLRRHRAPPPPEPPKYHRCQHCAKSHAGPEDCENWERLT